MECYIDEDWPYKTVGMSRDEFEEEINNAHIYDIPSDPESIINDYFTDTDEIMPKLKILLFLVKVMTLKMTYLFQGLEKN